jgi:isopenicillin N synthase-like dioxygenase
MTRNVPTLSLKDFVAGDGAARARFSADLMHGLQDYGFIVLKDHGISTDLLARAYDQAVAAFALPRAVKQSYQAGLRGYIAFGVEHAKDSDHHDLKEFWQIGHEASPDVPADILRDEPFPPNAWPDAELPQFRPTFQSLFHALNDTGVTLLQALATPLGLDEHHFDPMVRYGTSILRVLHYPPLRPEDDPQAVRAAAHEDINFLTIMVAARGAGLELLDRDGSWLPVETDPTNLIVDSGDMLQRMTNGVIPSTTHRVVNPSGPNVDRYSMPFFMHPTLRTPLAVAPSCLGDGPIYPETTAGEYLDERLRAIGLKT